jgi:hypothetical protein
VVQGVRGWAAHDEQEVAGVGEGGVRGLGANGEQKRE